MEAESILHRAVNANPRSVPARLEWATALSRLHRFQEAKAAMRGIPAPSDDPQGIAFYRLKASVDAGLLDFEGASDAMHSALRLSPDNAEFARACAAVDLRWLDAALSRQSRNLPSVLDTLRAIPLTGAEQAQLRKSAGEMLLQHGKYAEAAADLAEAVKHVPRDAEVWAQLAYVQLKSGDISSSLRSATQAKQLDDTAELEALLGDIYEAQGDSVSAVTSYQHAIKLAPDRENFRLELVLELLKHQTFQPAILILEKSCTDFPKSARLKTALGLTYYLVDRDRDALAALIEAQKLDPSFAPARQYLGEIALAQSQTPGASVVDAVCHYADARPGDGAANAICGGLQVRIAEAKGQPPLPSTLSRLSTAAHLSSAGALAHCQYGKALEEASDWQRARVQLEACTRLDPDRVEGHFRLARVYRKLKLNDLAAKESTLRAQAERRESAENEQRYRSATRFLFTLQESK